MSSFCGTATTGSPTPTPGEWGGPGVEGSGAVLFWDLKIHLSMRSTTRLAVYPLKLIVQTGLLHIEAALASEEFLKDSEGYSGHQSSGTSEFWLKLATKSLDIGSPSD